MQDRIYNVVPRYSFPAYLKSKLGFFVALVLFAAFLTVVLLVLTVSLAGIIFINIVMIIGTGIYLYIDYAREAAFWRSLSETAESLEDSAYLLDLIDMPSSLKGDIAYAAILAVLNADSENIASLKRLRDANAEYIELWVHEAKTPLAAAKLVAKRLNSADSIVIQRELERINDLIEQALFTAKTESLEKDYLIREIRLDEVAKEACKAHMHYLTSLNVALDFDIDPAISVYADKTWLSFIIAQIVINSAKYDAKKISFTATVPEEESSSASTILEIKDDGCGIPASDVVRVFDRGFTGEVGREHGSATGMGLYLVSHMCERMGISVMLASEEGAGTRVMLSFPHDRRRWHLAESYALSKSS